MEDMIIITGAANGMGREFLQHFIEEENKNILIIDIDEKELNNIKNKYPFIKILPLDLTKSSTFNKIKETIKDNKIKTLINCAGFGIFDHIENMSDDVEQEMIDLNVKAYVHMVNLCLPNMTKESHIVNIASCAGFQPIPYINIYAATKAFIVSYSRALKEELKYRKIYVTTVCPFWTKTKFFDRAIVKDKQDVVVNYSAMYDPKKVVEKAIKDMNHNKGMSVYGFTNKAQRMLVKMLPHSLVMIIWEKSQKFNGTPSIR